MGKEILENVFFGFVWCGFTVSPSRLARFMKWPHPRRRLLVTMFLGGSFRRRLWQFDVDM
jgi:hypothetical protein